MEITVTREFCYGHRIHNHPGKCRNLHGHNGTLTVTFSGAVKVASGMVCDFKDLRILVDEVLSGYDHLFFVYREDPAYRKLVDLDRELALTSVVGMDRIPTAENLCSRIANDLHGVIDEYQLNVRISCLKLEETRGNAVILRWT